MTASGPEPAPASRSSPASGSAPIRGYAWQVFRDPLRESTATGDDPFPRPAPGSGGPDGRDRSAWLPRGVLQRWRVDPQRLGLAGRAAPPVFLVVTEDREPPPLLAGWRVEVAGLDEGFVLEDRAGRRVRVRLLRRLGTAQTRHGAVPQCEFVVDTEPAAEPLSS